MNHPETKIDCSKVYVKQSTFSNEQTGMFDGAFAGVAFKEGKTRFLSPDMTCTEPRTDRVVGFFL
jgi:hypothetical protein